VTGTLLDELDALAKERDMLGKGFLGLALVITDDAMRPGGLPINTGEMMTKGGGQVRGASGTRVQSILSKYDIFRRLSSEGGRTSRGTPAKAKAYAEFLNNRSENIDLGAVLGYWIDRVRDYFASQPFVLDLDPALGVSGVVRNLVSQVEDRQKETPGATLVGTVIQHLIGAKLEIVLGKQAGDIAKHGASVNDAKGRGGDLEIGDTVIHITTAPGQLLVEKCVDNVRAGLRPIVITGRNRAITAESLIADQGLSGRVDVLDYEQFLAANVFEIGEFGRDGRRSAFERIIERYNEIIDRAESDPGLHIELR
jgi:hypothetical protein